MNRGIKGLLLLLALPFGCANNVTNIQSEPVLLFSYSVKGEIAQNPDVNYYLVVNASSHQSEGPTMNGPYALNQPNPGWNLPFYRDYDIDPGSAESLRDSLWTDYYQLSTEAGSFVMSHGWWPNPLEKSKVPVIYPDVGRLQQGKDWSVKSGTVTLTIPFSSFKGMQGDTPLYNAETGQVTQSYLNINLAVSRAEGAVIDFPTVNSNLYLTIPTRVGVTENTNPYPVKNAANIPAGVSPDSVDIVSYRAEIKRY